MAFTDEEIKAFPAWLQKLAKMSPQGREAAGYTDEDLAQAAKAHHLDKDYTQKSQKAASLEKIQDQYPDLNLEDAGKVWDWWQKNGDAVTELWPHRSKIKEIVAHPADWAATNGNADRPAAGKRRWREAEAADLYETAKLREVFEDLSLDTREATIKALKEDWYQKEEIPRLDRVAGGYLDTVVELLDFVQEQNHKGRQDPNYAPLSVREMLKESAARGEKDFRKVAKAVVEERQTTRNSAFEEGRKQGVEEGKKAPEGPSGPVGGGQPAWRPAPADQKPKTRGERAEAVIATVEKKYGQRLPL